MNILVTGSNGQLGRELRRISLDSPDRFIFTDINELPGAETIHLDITDENAVRIIAESEQVDAIVNCAAYTSVEKAEDDVEFADLLNHHAPEILAKTAKERGATLVHISTDYVFSGENHLPIRENETPAPKNVYGGTKLAGEKAIAKSGCKYIIIRTSWLYSPYGKNFVRTMRSLMSARESVSVVCDQIGTPTSASDLAAALLHIISSRQLDKTGIYHFSDEGAISWYDFAQAIRELSGLERCRVVPCPSEAYPSKVRRPHYSVLDKSLIKRSFGLEIPYWKDSLKDVIGRL